MLSDLDIEELQVNNNTQHREVENTQLSKHFGSCEGGGGMPLALAPTSYAVPYSCAT